MLDPLCRWYRELGDGRRELQHLPTDPTALHHFALRGDVVGVDGRRDDAADGRGRTRGSEDAFDASESRVETLAPGRSPGRYRAKPSIPSASGRNWERGLTHTATRELHLEPLEVRGGLKGGVGARLRLTLTNGALLRDVQRG